MKKQVTPIHPLLSSQRYRWDMTFDETGVSTRMSSGIRQYSDPDKLIVTPDMLTGNKLLTKRYAELLNTGKRIEDIFAEYDTLMQQVEKLGDELNVLFGPRDHYGHMQISRGLIKKQYDLLRAELRKIEQSGQRVVIFKEGDTSNKFVVHKVTPKRIYIQRYGDWLREFFYTNDGEFAKTCSSIGLRIPMKHCIDVEATFPEGLKEYRANQNGAKS